MNLQENLAQAVLKRIETLKEVEGIKNETIKRDAGLNNLQKKIDGVVAVTAEDVLKICATYGVRKEWLEGGDGPMYNEEKLKEKKRVYQRIFGGDISLQGIGGSVIGNEFNAAPCEKTKYLEQRVLDLQQQNTSLQQMVEMMRELLKQKM